MAAKKVELNEENLEGVAGGGIGVNTNVKTKVDTTSKNNVDNKNTTSNVNSKTNTNSNNSTNTVSGKGNKVYQQGTNISIGGKSEVKF